MFNKLHKRAKIMLGVFLVFIIWMLFFDENSYLTHRELDKELNKLETSNDYFEKEIDKDNKVTKELENPKTLEKFARETYKMKKENEEIFLIEFDTLPK
ncbi:MAG: septum formation initiator family protein [Flavobacteriaceae bacterium]